MRNVLADLAVESEAATAAGAAAGRRGGPRRAAAFQRLAIAVGKFWVCKRQPAVVGEALECLGGNGYVEESGLPRLYRDAPLNSIWEGSGNVQALDVLRALRRDPDSLEAFLAEVAAAAGADRRLDDGGRRPQGQLAGRADPEPGPAGGGTDGAGAAGVAAGAARAGRRSPTRSARAGWPATGATRSARCAPGPTRRRSWSGRRTRLQRRNESRYRSRRGRRCAGRADDEWWTGWTAARLVVRRLLPACPPRASPRTWSTTRSACCPALMILLAVRLHRPADRACWYWFAAGRSPGSSATWCTSTSLVRAARRSRTRRWPTLFYLRRVPDAGGRLCSGWSAARRGRDLAGLVDAAIVGDRARPGLLGLRACTRSPPTSARLDARTADQLGLPGGDALLLAMLARMLHQRGAAHPERPAARLRRRLLLLVADVGFSLLTLYSENYAAASSTPASCYVVRALGRGGPAPVDARPARYARGPPARTRSAAAGSPCWPLSSLLAPAMLFVRASGTTRSTGWPSAVGAVVLFLLVLVRMSGFVAPGAASSPDQLEDLAMRDDLTGLRQPAPVRAAAPRGRWPTGRAAGRACSTWTASRTVNDRLGHAVGDRLLVAVAERLSAAHARTPTLVARMGGDEFAVLLPDADAADGDAIVARLAAALREPVRGRRPRTAGRREHRHRRRHRHRRPGRGAAPRRRRDVRGQGARRPAPPLRRRPGRAGRRGGPARRRAADRAWTPASSGWSTSRSSSCRTAGSSRVEALVRWAAPGARLRRARPTSSRSPSTTA